jgi:hypothetical protein
MAMVFPTSPTVGQVFTSAGRSWVWNGSAWDAPSATNVLTVPIGLELIRATTISALSSQSFDNVFSSQYNNYFAICDFTRSTTSNITFRMRNDGTNDDGSNYIQQNMRASGGSVTGSTSTGTTGFINGAGAPTQLYASINIYKPFLASKTNFLSNFHGADPSTGIINTEHQLTNSYDGFTIIASAGTITGTIRIYGYKN